MIGIILKNATVVGIAVGGTGTGNGRGGAIVAGVAALISVVIGGLALARSAGRIGTGNGRGGAIVAAVVALVGMVIGGLHLAGSDGGIGTGNGRVGAIVAMVLALIGMVLAGLALARSRRPADPAMVPGLNPTTTGAHDQHRPRKWVQAGPRARAMKSAIPGTEKAIEPCSGE